VPATLFVVPLAASLAWSVAGAIDALAWSRLCADTQFMPALRLGVWVGAASTLLAAGCTVAIVTRVHGTPSWQRLQAMLPALLAVPHAAFAIGLALLVMPSGLVARLLAPLAGWTSPPDVATVQDPWGLALIAGLVLKEVPFLLWSVAAQWRHVGQGALLERQLQTAAAMGYARSAAWGRVLWPQLLPRLALPLAAVWAYGLTVVDMALVLGPTRPPTLAVLAWQWLLDADPATNRVGAAAALVLATVMAVVASLVVLAWRTSRSWRATQWTRGDRPLARSPSGRRPGWGPRILATLYLAVLAMLAFVSLAGVWTFPDLLPQAWSAGTWSSVAVGAGTVGLTLALALAAATTGLVLAVAWMETTPARWDTHAAPAVFATLLIPGVLLAGGLYQAALHTHLDGRFTGLWLAHSLYAAPYVLIALAPAYRSHDPRYAQTAHALGHGRARVLLRVTWPMLLAPMASAFAVGFAVSVTQYLPTQFVGAGRHATLTTEALTLASGGQRPVAAAFALLQAVLPAAMFAAAWWIGERQARRLRVPATA
jgi:putative thiamine transport system permease protein